MAQVVTFFVLAALTTLACLFAFALLRKSEVVKHYGGLQSVGRKTHTPSSLDCSISHTQSACCL